MCNNSPAEATSPENGWRLSVALIPDRCGRAGLYGPDAATSRKVAGVARKALGVILAGAAPGADLGGSSKYSREALEDRCGEGFRVNSRWTRVSRP